MALPIQTEKTRDKDGNRCLKSKSCPFFCVRCVQGQQVPCDLYKIEAGQEWCLSDEVQEWG